MGEKIHQHIRSNVVGYVAVFLALTGTAYAVDGPLPGTNQVGSADIINKEIRTEDIRDNNVLTPNLGPNAVTSPKIADGAVQSSDVANDTLTDADIANRQRAINIPLGSFINCSNPGQIGFVSGNDNDPDFVTQGANRLQVAWDAGAGTDTTPDTDAICASVMVPPDIGGNAPTVRLLSIAGSAHDNDWVVTVVQQRDGADEEDTGSAAGFNNCDQFKTTGTAYVCSFTLGLGQPGEVQPNDVFTVGVARGGGNNEMRLYGVQFEYTSQQ